MNFLITGATGFIGKNLARYLSEKNYNVKVLFRNREKRNLLDFIPEKNFIIKDLLEINENDLNGIDVVVHLAGTTDNYNILSDPLIDIKTNCEGTIKVLEACKKNKTKIIMMSTFFVHGNPKEFPVNEDSALNPLALYPATRLATEFFLRIYNSNFGIPYVILRLTNVYGPGEQVDNKKKGAISYLMYNIFKGEKIKLYSNGMFFRDFLYVKDVSRAVEHFSLINEYDNNLYFVGGEKMKFYDFVNEVAEQSGKELNYESIEPPEFHKKVGIADFFVDKSKLESTGFRNKYSIKKGVEETLQWMKSLS